MKAVIRLDVPDWQIGQEVAVYFPDTMRKHGICEKDQTILCKDCMHYQSGIDINGKPFTRCNGKDENNRIFKSYGNTEPDWYCADGKRRAEE